MSIALAAGAIVVVIAAGIAMRAGSGSSRQSGRTTSTTRPRTTTTSAVPTTTPLVFECGPITRAAASFTRVTDGLPDRGAPTKAQIVAVLTSYRATLDAIGVQVGKESPGLAAQWSTQVDPAFEAAIVAARGGATFEQATAPIKVLDTPSFLVIRTTVEDLVSKRCGAGVSPGAVPSTP
jgi:hypothetical protein